MLKRKSIMHKRMTTVGDERIDHIEANETINHRRCTTLGTTVVW